jgi:hypothetical protein
VKKIAIFLTTITFIAALMILQINQNVALIQQSYTIRDKEKELAMVSDQYKQLVFEINSLHSPGKLQNKIIESGIHLIHPTNIKIIKNMVPVDATLLAKNVNVRDRFGILSSIEFIPEAHANSSE